MPLIPIPDGVDLRGGGASPPANPKLIPVPDGVDLKTGSEPKAQTGDSNTALSIRNLARSVSRGVPIIGGLLDEADAATNAAIDPLTHYLGLTKNQIPGATFSERYNNALAAQRGMDKDFDTAHPIISTGAQLAGGLAAGGALAKGAPAVARAVFGGPGGTLAERVAGGIGRGVALGGADAFTRGEGGFDNRVDNAEHGAVLGGVVGGVAPVVAAGAGRMFGTHASVPTLDDLQTQSNALYDAADNSGVTIRGTSFNRMATGLADDMRQSDILDPVLHPKADRAMERILGATNVPGAPQTSRDISIRDVDKLRRIVGIAANSPERDERRIAGIMQDRLDNYMTGLQPNDVVGGNPQNVGGILEQARDLFGRMRRGESLTDLVDRAQLKTAQGGNLGSAIASEFKTLALNQAQMRRYTPEEQEAIRGVAEGTLTTRGLGALSKLGHGMLGNIIALGGLVSGHPEAMAPKVVGEAAAGARSLLTGAQADRAAAIARNGGAVPTPQLTPQQHEAFLRRMAAAIPALNGLFGK